MDLDGFKPVNDRLGHDAGDTVLTIVAQRLKTAVRIGDLVVRVGGDEFVVVVHMALTDELLDVICTRIRNSLREEIPLEKETVSIDISIGRSIFPDDGDSYEVLMEKADLDMLRRKVERKKLGDDAKPILGR
jgi:diguanylate cyclase (GGDEF)-like protein